MQEQHHHPHRTQVSYHSAHHLPASWDSTSDCILDRCHTAWKAAIYTTPFSNTWSCLSTAGGTVTSQGLFQALHYCDFTIQERHCSKATLLLTDFCAPYGPRICNPCTGGGRREGCRWTCISSPWNSLSNGNKGLGGKGEWSQGGTRGVYMHASKWERLTDWQPLVCYCNLLAWKGRTFYYAQGRLLSQGRNIAACLFSNIMTVSILCQFPQEHKTCKSYKAPTLSEWCKGAL